MMATPAQSQSKRYPSVMNHAYKPRPDSRGIAMGEGRGEVKDMAVMAAFGEE